MISPHAAELERRLQAAIHAFEVGDHAAAEAVLRGVLELAPNEPNALQLLGIVLFHSGREAEAIVQLEASLAIEPANADAWLNLGNMLATGNRTKAEQAFRKALELAPGLVPARGCLASMFVESGRFADAVIELRTLLTFAPDDDIALRLLAKSLRETRDFAGAIEAGLRAFRGSPDDGLKRAISHTYFLWFDSVDREPEVARRVLDAWMAFDPTDPVAEHMHAALTGVMPPKRASDAYVERHFDEFAPTFDQVLAGLDYRAPEQVAQQLARFLPSPSRALALVDLGCGTGLCGPLVKPWAARLVGVDLSGKMLERAKATGAYDELVQRELTAYLAEQEDRFDGAIAADTFIYFGQLEEVFAATLRALSPGGLFVSAYEVLAANDDASFRLHAGGRYAHAEAYVTSALGAAGFAIRDVVAKTLRLNYLEPVRGIIVSAQRPDGATSPSQR